MTENGPACMYSVKPLYDFNPVVELSTCMYKMPSIYDTSTKFQSNDEPNDQKVISNSEEYDTIGKKQLEIIKRLEGLKDKVLDLKKVLNVSEQEKRPADTKNAIKQNLTSGFKPQDIVVKANPEYPPYSLWVIFHLLREKLQVQLVTYIHSSLTSLPPAVKQLSNTRSDGKFDLTLTVIWKDTGKNQEMMVDPIHQGMIEAEVNIARYLARLLSFGYDSDPYAALQIDYWLELAHSSMIHGSNKERNAVLKSLNSHLGKHSYLAGEAISLADIVMWSTLLQCRLHEDLPNNVSKWWKVLMDIPMFHSVVSS